MRYLQLNLLSLAFFTTFCFGQTMVSVPEMCLTFKHFKVRDKELGDVNFYLKTDGVTSPKPLLVFLDGSGNSPLFRYVRDKNSTMILQSVSAPILDNLNQYSLLLISKPSVAFADTVSVNDLSTIKASQLETSNPAYDARLSLDWRVNAANLAINEVAKNRGIPFSQIVVMGYSEGARVAPKVALVNKKVTKVVCLVSGGLNQFYDFIIEERIKADKGEISHEQSQKDIDSLYKKIEEIYNDPYNTKKYWEGHTYLRWSSFCAASPIEDMLKLNIPIYIAKGTNDHNSQVLSYDYVNLEFLRLRKSNLTYVNYPGADHGFNRTIIVKGTKKGINEIDKVFASIFSWMVH
jgi:predicted esterase